MFDAFPEVRTSDAPPPLSGRYVVVDPERAAELHSVHSRRLHTQAPPGGQITQDVPNVGGRALADLDDQGIIRSGATVRPGSILVGRVEPIEGVASPEEKLLRAIFGEAAGSVRDVSLRAPAHLEGTVVRSGWSDGVEVVIEWERPLEVGDILELEGGEPVLVGAIQPTGGKILRDGQAIEGRVKKVAMARDTLRYRSIGPYDPATKCPTSDPDQRLGQLLTKQQAFVLGEHAPWMLFESFTSRCDGVRGRTLAYEALVKYGTATRPSVPASSTPSATGGGIFGIFAGLAVPLQRGRTPRRRSDAGTRALPTFR